MPRWLFVVAPAALAGCALVTGLGDYVIEDAAAPDPDAGSVPAPPFVEAGRDARADADVGDAGSTPEADAAVDSGATCDEPGLLARWTFDEVGSLVRDCTSNGHDGVLSGGAGRGGGRSGGGLVMDAGAMTFDATSAFTLTTNLSICAWARPKAFPPDPFAACIAAKSKGVNTDGWRLGVDVANGMTFAVARGGGGPYVEVTSGPIATDTWIHACGVFKPTTVELYVNGALTKSAMDAPVAILNSPDALTVGNRQDRQRPFNGAIDEVRIYDRALTAAEVFQLAR